MENIQLCELAFFFVVHLFQISRDIFNLSLSSGIFPDSWKVARVAPIFKKGPSDERSNCRPISVLPAVSRLFENSCTTILISRRKQTHMLATVWFSLFTLCCHIPPKMNE